LKINLFKIHQIIDKGDPYFADFWEIYSNSFPFNERRTIEQQRLILNKRGYQLDIYFLDLQLVGFIAFWTAKEFIFIEHFAVASEFRNNGLGSAILKPFIKSKTTPIILEIEIPSDEQTRRRLRFYESLGFIKNKYIHFQPPYHNADGTLRLEVLTFPEVISDDMYYQFAQFQKKIVMA
jgi:ribosomal protein S18 acetylase RimI-like enzyme